MKYLNTILFSLIIILLVVTVFQSTGLPYHDTYPEILVDSSDTTTTIAAIEFPFKRHKA
jgi:hypothetical protein